MDKLKRYCFIQFSRYLYLTWGPYRLTQTYSPPLTIPGDLLSSGNTIKAKKVKSKRTEIPITDIAFVQEALLIATLDEGEIIRVHGLEMTYVELSETPRIPLKYSVAKGNRKSFTCQL